MERKYFKLAAGFLHVDNDGITFTRSGNWGEAGRTRERGGAMEARHWARVAIGFALLTIGALFSAVHGAHGPGSGAVVLGTAGGLFGAYHLYSVMRNDMARAFRIPFNKVRSIHFAEGKLRIDLLNAHFKEDHVEVEFNEADAADLLAAWNENRTP